MDIINNFKGKYAFLSNSYEAPIEYEGITYKNNEAAFQAQKTFSIDMKLQFSNLSPKDAKRLGKNVFLRRDWNNVKEKIMLDIVRAKFKQNSHLAKWLINTEDIIIDDKKNKDLCDILMQVRTEIINNCLI